MTETICELRCFVCKKIILEDRCAKIIEIKKEKEGIRRDTLIEYISDQKEIYTHINCLFKETPQITCQATEENSLVRNDLLEFIK